MKNYVGLYYRLMERILLICVENRESKLSEEDSSKWTARFTAILDHVSSIVGHVIKLGQEIHTEDGRSYFATCTELVAEHINPKWERLVQMWACALYCTRKVSLNFVMLQLAKRIAPILRNCSLGKLYICMSGAYRMAISKYFGLIGPLVDENAP